MFIYFIVALLILIIISLCYFLFKKSDSQNNAQIQDIKEQDEALIAESESLKAEVQALEKIIVTLKEEKKEILKDAEKAINDAKNNNGNLDLGGYKSFSEKFGG